MQGKGITFLQAWISGITFLLYYVFFFTHPHAPLNLTDSKTHSKSITKPKCTLQPHLALQQNILSESAFIRKYICAHYLLYGPIRTVVVILGLCYDSYRACIYKAYFFYFLSFMNTQASKSAQISRKYACTLTVIAQPQKMLQRFLRCHLKDNWHSYLFLKKALSDKMCCFSARWGWSSNLGFVMFLKCYNWLISQPNQMR